MTTSAPVATKPCRKCLLQHEAERMILPAEYADDSLALKKELSERHGNDLRYTAAWGRWSVWDGACWKQDQTLDVFDLARKVCRAESAACENERLASRIGSAVTVAAVERLARADRRHAATIDQWDSDPWLLNLAAAWSISVRVQCGPRPAKIT